MPIKNNNLEITVFDVGNADSFLVKTPQNEYLIIDTGKAGYNGGKSQAEIIMLKYFKDAGIKRLNSIILSHFDNDHCGGAADLMKGLKVNDIYINDINHRSNAAKLIISTAKKEGVNVIEAYNNQTVYDSKGLKLVNYITFDGKSDNSKSIITLLEYKNFTMLFTGDAGINSIKTALEFLPKNITVLKAPHHGAVGGVDTDLVRYLNPEYSVISTGENKFGHPSVYTLELLKNTKIIRTDVNNSIKFKVNTRGIKVLTYDPKSRKYRDFK